MAGSKKYYNYESVNLNQTFWIIADESNVESVNGATPGWDTGDTLVGRPFNLRPRLAVYVGQDADGGEVVVRAPVLARADTLEDLPTGFDVSSGQVGGANVTVFRRGITPERLRGQPVPTDTGRTDGDN